MRTLESRDDDERRPSEFDNTEGAELRLELFGGFRVSCAGVELPTTSWRSRNASQIVKRLALEPNYTMSREQLADLLWPDAGIDSLANSLRQALHMARSQLRRLPLDPELVLRSAGERVELYPSAKVWTDVRAFEHAALRALDDDNTALYWSAIETYTGPLLPGDMWAEWTNQCRDEVGSLYLTLLERVARLHQARGEYAQATVALQRLVAAEPFLEAAHVELMRLYEATGKRPLALRQYHHLTRALAEMLDLEPEPSTTELYESIKNSGTMSQSGSHRFHETQTNLPRPVTSFVGRRVQLEEVVEEIAHHRLVTLTGLGGIGKTRLALEAAWQLIDAFHDGVWLVELAGRADPDLVAQAVIGTLGIAPDGARPVVEVIASTLRHSEMLLVLDNCEHVLDACATLVDSLLRACPNVHILTTSREALCLSGEIQWPVPVLSMPSAAANLDETIESEAVQLFVQRVRDRNRRFAVTPVNVKLVGEICRRLDGIPLGLELAAARASVLALPQLAARLNDALTLLATGPRGAPSRQQTLRATLDWSYQLLDSFEQRLFRRVAVFSGGWTLDAAESICADNLLPRPTILGLLGQLTSKSLVQTDLDEDEARYRLLEPVRQYALGLLEADGEADVLRERHAAYAVAFLEAIEPELTGPHQASFFDRINREHDNLRAVLHWALDRNDAETAFRVEAVLWRFWSIRWHSAEGLSWIQRTLAIAGPQYSLPRARATIGAGELARRIPDFEQAIALLEEALAASREIHDDSSIAWSLAYLAHVLAMAGRFDESREPIRESLGLFQMLGDKLGMARTLNMLGEDARLQGDYATAAANYHQALELDHARGDQLGIVTRLHNLGYVALHHGNIAGAARSFSESYDINTRLGNRGGMLSFLEGMAATASAAGLAEQSARLYGAWEAHSVTPGSEFKLHPPDQIEFDRYTTRAATAIGRAAFERAWEDGGRLSFEEALAEAQSVVPTLSGITDDEETRTWPPTTGRVDTDLSNT